MSRYLNGRAGTVDETHGRRGGSVIMQKNEWLLFQTQNRSDSLEPKLRGVGAPEHVT